jgi:hypothetical protein
LKPTDAQKVEFLNEHVCYEAEELLLCHAFIYSLTLHQAEIEKRGLYPALQNTGLEHFGLHARNLLEFLFYPHDNSGKYARAVDYLKGWNDIRQRTPNIKILEKRVNAELTHLSWDRLLVKPEKKGWQPLLITQDLLDVFETFLAKIDDHYKLERAKQLQAGLAVYKRAVWEVFGILLGTAPTTVPSTAQP